MKWTTRLALILVVLSFALTMVTIIRGSSSYTGGMIMTLDGSESGNVSVNLPPRDVRLTSKFPDSVDITVLNPTNATIVTEANVTSGGIVKFHADLRGRYTFQVTNPDTNKQFGSIDITVYNFESDLIMASIVLAVSGIALAAVGMGWRSFSNRRRL